MVEKDALFIPCGWDNEKKIAILYENIQSVSPDDPYADVIQKPQRMPVGMRGEDELMAEDDQIFLTKMQSQLNQSIPSNASPQNPGFRPSPAVQKSNADRRSLAGVVQSPTPTQVLPFYGMCVIDTDTNHAIHVISWMYQKEVQVERVFCRISSTAF